jgi:hypothetical protein
MISLMDIIIEQPFHYMIGDYLSINDNKNLMKLNKDIYHNKISRIILKKLIAKKSKNLIYKFFKKYSKYIEYVNNLHNNYRPKLITKKINAIYYFKNYEKKYINSWYNLMGGSKKMLIDNYKDEDELKKENPTRYDLYRLIKKMNVNDVLYVGW